MRMIIPLSKLFVGSIVNVYNDSSPIFLGSKSKAISLIGAAFVVTIKVLEVVTDSSVSSRNIPSYLVLTINGLVSPCFGFLTSLMVMYIKPEV